MDDQVKAADVAQTAIVALRESARSNKRLAEAARRAARRDMTERERIIKLCTEAGINVTIEPKE